MRPFALFKICSLLLTFHFYRYEKRLAVEEDETGLGSVDGEVLRRGDKVRILHHQPKDFTTEARFKEKEFQVRFLDA